MTDAIPRPPSNPYAPEVLLPPAVQTSAGFAVSVPVQIRHRGRIPARMRITVLGLDSRWAPEPLELGPMEPGEAAQVTLTLVPERGALGARYPFVVAVESTAVRGQDGPIMGLAESTLAVDSQERISMTIQPPTPTAVFGKKFRVQITNPGSRDRAFTLVGDAASGASVSLQQDQVEVPAQRTVSVKGRVRIRRPTFFGGENTHAFAVTAQGVGAPEFAEATVRSTPLIGRGPRMVVGLVLVVALWASLAIVFIPKISDAFKPKSVVGAPSTVTSQGPAASTGAGAPGQSGTGGSSGAGGNGNGGNGSGGSGSGGGGQGGGSGNGEGSGGGAQQAGYQLAGTVTGAEPKGVMVTLAPTSLVGASDAGAQTAPGSSQSTGNAFREATSGALGKIPAEALQVVRDGDGADNTTTVLTNAGGEFGFAGITAPGYYLLTVSKTGFQTQKFLINSADLASPQPLKIAMVPGAGKLSGTVTGPDGAPIGAATVIVTDGTVTVQTSSVSASAQGTPGTWTADNLSTPGTYLVTVTAPGYGGASSLIKLGPKGSATADLSLVPGQGSIVGTVTGQDGLGQFGGLGGISVTATDGDVTRTATTVTSQALRGTFILPNMPTPGEYTMTISGDGFLTQTRTVTIAEGVGSATVNATLSRSDSVVEGTVTGVDAAGKSQGGLVGVGLTLTSSTTTLKTMTTSGDQAGTYRFTGVPPGTYVLTASQYGRTPASATVEIKASESKNVALKLVADSAAELPATSHIRGQVVDSRTGGPLTCDRTAVPIDAKDCVVTVSVSAPVNPADASQGTITITSTSTAALDYVYTVPRLDDAKHPGLPPGLYTVTVSAPGYETTITHVQVAQGQTAPAPQVSLPVLGVITGTITTRVGTPNAPSCVIAVPAETKVPKPLPTSCSPDPDTATCTVPGLPAQPCGLTSTGAAGQGAAGTYQVRGLKHGRYQMLVIAQDPEYRYVVSDPPIIELELGGDGQFNAVLDRLGRVQLTVFDADRQSGALSAAKGAALTVKDLGTGKTRSAGAAAADGTATITGLNGNYIVSATLGDTTASAGSGPVGLNQTVSLTLVIAAPVGPVVGRVTTNNGLTSDPVPVSGAVVTISGTIGYNGSTPVSGSVNVTTDAHGCYAIVPAGWSAASGQNLTTPDCPQPVVDAASITTMMTVTSDGQSEPATLQSDRIGMAVKAVGKLTQSYPVTSAVITGSDAVRIIPTVSVLPQPVSVGDLSLTIAGPPGFTAPIPTDVNVVVQGKPGLAGGVSIKPAASLTTTADGYSLALSFSDTNLPAPMGMPGRYGLLVTLPNFVSVQADLLCDMGGSCTFVQPGSTTPLPSGVVLKELPSITGVIPGSALPGGGAPDWSSAVVNRISGPTQLGNISLVADATDPNIGVVLFDGATSVLAAAGGKYVFSISVPGFSPENVTVTCGLNYSADPAPTGCTLLTPTSGQLTKLPTFAGSLVLLAPSGVTVPASAATVTAVDTVNTANTIQITVTQDPIDPTRGALSWLDAPQPQDLVAPGSYAITVSAPGFAPRTVPFACTAGATCGPAGGVINLLMSPQISGTISLPSGGPAADVSTATVTVTKYPSTAGAITVDVTDNGDSTGAVHFTDASLPAPGTNGLPAALALPGTYVFSVSLAGYQTQSVTVVCGSDYTWAGEAGVDPAPVNGCQPLSTTMRTLPALSGSTVTLGATTYPYDSSKTFSTSDIIASVSPNPGSAIDVSVDANRNLKWAAYRSGALPGQVIPGNYTITYSMSGFRSETATLNCTTTVTQCTQSPAAVQLKMLPVAAGTVTIPLPSGSPGVDLTGANITVTATHPANATGLRLTLASSGGNDDGQDGTIDATLRWSDSGLPFAGIVQPDTYTVSITLPGYDTATVTDIDCTGYGTTCNPDFSLVLHPQPVLKITVLPPTLTAAVLSVTGGPSGAGKVKLTADADGTLTWQQAGLPTGVVAPGSKPYTIQAQLAGYTMVVDGAVASSASFTCTDDSCVFPDIVMTAPSTLLVNLQDAAGNAATEADLTLTRTVSGSTTTIGSPATSTGTATFPGLATTAVQGTDPATAADQSYKLAVKAAGFAFASGTGALTSSSANVSCSNGTVTVTGLRLIPGGTTTCTITLTRLATINAQTVGDIMPLTGTTRIGTNALPAIDVTATKGTDTFTVTSGSTGGLTITGTKVTAGLTPGTWTLTASPTGYQALSGTVVIADDNTISSVTGPLGLGTDTAGKQLVTVHLTPDPVAFQVHLQSGGADVLAQAAVTLTDQASPANTVSCNTAQTPAPDCVTGKYVTFAAVPPATYTVSVDFPDGTYTDIPPFTTVVKPTGVDQFVNLNISAQVSSLTGAIVDSNGNPITTTATAELWTWGSDTGPAKDFAGDDLRVDVDNGVFTFSQIISGNYKVVVTAPGYATGMSGIIPITYGQTPAPPTVTVPVAKTDVDLTIDSVAGTALDLSGATVTLTPTGTSPHSPANTEMSVNVTAAGPVTIGQVPSGQWTVTVSGQSGAPFDSHTTANLTVPDSVDGGGAYQATLTLDQAATTIKLTWSTADCVVPPSPGSTIPLSLAKTGGSTKTVNAIVDNSTPAKAQAVALVPLPPGTYSWTADVSALPAWQAPASAQQFTIASGTATKTSSAALTALAVDVTANLTVNGSPGTSAMGGTITATCNADAAKTSSEDLSSGTATLSLPPGVWNFSLSGLGSGFVSRLTTAQSVTVTADGPNEVTFAGLSLQPVVNFAQPTGRDADTTSRTVSVKLYAGSDATGTQIWAPATNPTIPGSDKSYTGPTVIVPVPPAPQGYYLAASTTGAFFGAGSASVTLDGTETSVTPMTASLAYTAAMLAVTVSGGSDAAASGATLTLSKGGSVVNQPKLKKSGATTTYYDLTVSSAYSVTASYTDTTDNGNQYGGTATTTTGAAGSTTALPLALSATTTSVILQIDAPTGGGGAQTGVGASVTLSLSGSTVASGTATNSGPNKGRIVLSGLAPSTVYDLTATFTTGGKTYVAPAAATVTSPASGTVDRTDPAIELVLQATP
jgi:hypothetical protein